MKVRPLRLALVGYGKMGRAIEALAPERGHRVVARVDPTLPEGEGTSLDTLAGSCDVAFEFSSPAAGADNVGRLIRQGVPVVSGTTGWSDRLGALQAEADRRGVGFLWAPNFSLGVNLLFRLAATAARALGELGEFSPWLWEAHHDAKQDGPSGTACRIAEIVVEQTPGKTRYGPAPAEGAVDPELLPVAWIRAGSIPGEHRLGWDGPGESLEIIHRARSREIFAIGALRCAEWLVGRRGSARLEDMLDEILGNENGDPR
ncbi:MAG: 4-hydroxy-tetrahydrodipicolinate reductase [Acidobacteriota bacterium]|nr:4-hydroxy-tetrahydrodipicolinate reductase [Acidobacteriota bacterium]